MANRMFASLDDLQHHLCTVLGEFSAHPEDLQTLMSFPSIRAACAIATSYHVSLEAVLPQVIATLMQDFGTLLHVLRQRSRVNPQEVLRELRHLGYPLIPSEYSRREKGIRAPQMEYLAVLSQALVQSGVEIRAEEREASLLLARGRISAKARQQSISLTQWDQLARTLMAFDAGEEVIPCNL